MDLWQYLSTASKAIVMYGMGDGADKILAVCECYEISIADFFASDAFVRGQSFHGKRVLSFSDIIDKYGKSNIIVLVAFASSLPEVMEHIRFIGEQCEMYIPDVPVRGASLFCEAYEKENAEVLRASYELLADDRSREVFRGVLDFRRTGRIEPLLSTAESKDAIIHELLHLNEYRTVVDVGAYNGDTAEELISLCPGLDKIYAIEPDRRNYAKLARFASFHTQVIPVNAAAWSENTTLIFDDSGNRNAGLADSSRSRRSAEVKAITLDSLITEKVEHIKYDVEGAEAEALLGSRETIQRYKPDLLVSLYHRTEDLHRLIMLVHTIMPEYELYLRRYPYIPAWDLNLYATIKK